MSTEPDDLYRALLNDRRLSHLRRLTYRCAPPAHRCLLLDAVDTPMGILLHQTRHKYSQVENERRSNASGRAKNTSDGDNHWLPRTYWIGQSALAHPDDRPTPQLEVTCDHVLGRMVAADEFAADWDAGHAVVLLRPDGSRLVYN